MPRKPASVEINTTAIIEIKGPAEVIAATLSTIETVVAQVGKGCDYNFIRLRATTIQTQTVRTRKVKAPVAEKS